VGRVSGAAVRFGHSLRISGLVKGLTQDELTRLRVEAIGNDPVLRMGDVGRNYPDHYEIGNLPAGSWTIVARVTGTDRQVRRSVTLFDQDERLDLEFKGLPKQP
jgi:hypothetical protein